MNRYSLAILIVALPFFIGNCGSVQPMKIQQVTFTRLGMVISLNKVVVLTSVELNGISQSQDTFTSTDQAEVYLDYNWQPAEEYKIELTSLKGEKAMLAVAAPQYPTVYYVASSKLGPVTPAKITHFSLSAGDDVKVSADGKYVGVASFDQHIYLFNAYSKKRLWSYKIPQGRGYSIAFSHDGKFLLAGERSPEGLLYAFDTESGNLRWQFDSSELVGHPVNYDWGNFPQVLYIITDEQNRAYVALQRRTRLIQNKVAVYYYQSYICCFEVASGKLLWKFPEHEPMDVGISRVRLSRQHNYLVFATTSWTSGKKYREGTIYCLDQETGSIYWSYNIPPLKPQFDYIRIGDGIDVSPNGQYVSVLSGAGRGYLFDNQKIIASGQPEPLWQKNIGTPFEVSGIPIYASGNAALVLDDGSVIFFTSSTYVTKLGKSLTEVPPIKHPNQTSIMIYNLAGKLNWRHDIIGRLGGSNISKAGNYLVVAVGHDLVNHDTDVHGIYCLNLRNSNRNKINWFYKTEGIMVAAAIAANGKTIAGIEAPIILKDNVTTLGEHRLHVLQ